MKRTLFALSLLFAMTSPPAHSNADPSLAAGTWYLNANNTRLTLTITGQATGPLTAAIAGESTNSEPVDNIAWDPEARVIGFRRNAKGLTEWYRATVVDGVLTGRFATSADSRDKPPIASYKYHVTGWNSALFDQSLAPRVYDIVISGRDRATLRIDSSPDSPSGYAGRLKVYSDPLPGAAGEQLETDLEVTHWDGSRLTFIRHDRNPVEQYTGTVTGRTISGTFTSAPAAAPSEWIGSRAQVLSYGFGAPRDPASRAAWQERTRRELALLMMAGSPAPLSHKATVLASNLEPLSPTPYPPERDDNPAAWPQRYRLTELRFDYLLAAPFGVPPVARTSHGYLAEPTVPPPPGRKYPAVLAVNGHGGSAWKVMNGGDRTYWYGDAFARRGFVVLALDISHRPLEDRSAAYMSTPLYTNEPNGDDPAHGNGLHPAIKAAGFDSDWEESGERVWDAMRALDYLLALPNVDPARVLVTGLSMGGEVTTLTSALDTRVTMSIPGAYSPDSSVLRYHGNHPCWQWLHADIGEYIDTSDLFALIAPRPLVVETGKIDTTYSRFRAPFAADKQVLRRARVAYAGETGNLIHYLHYDKHSYHAGDVNPTHESEQAIRIPELIQPAAPWSSEWQSDPRTHPLRATLFDLVSFFLGRD